MNGRAPGRPQSSQPVTPNRLPMPSATVDLYRQLRQAQAGAHPAYALSKMVAWHEGWKPTGRDKDGRVVYDAPRVITREITIPARGDATIEFELK